MSLSRLRKLIGRFDEDKGSSCGAASDQTDQTGAGDHDAPPGSEILALNRLNLQHFLWTKIFGYKLHPSIPIHESMRIADVGTGTGVWLLDLSDDLPDSVQYHGFDTDPRQAPAPPFRPGNIHFEYLDIFADLPAALEGKFDIVNVRLFMYVIKNGNPRKVVKNLFEMLKPGGWLQWAEVDMAKREWVLADRGGSYDALKNMHNKFHSFDPDFKTKFWIGSLDRSLTAAGFTGICADRRTSEDQMTTVKLKKWLHFRSQVAFQTYTSVTDQLPSRSSRQDLQVLLGAGEQELLDGSMSIADHVNWIAQKPSHTFTETMKNIQQH